jgi:hypothetical protein
MNRAQLTDELILQKKENEESIQEIAKLKASSFRFKSYVSYIAVLLVVGAVVVTSVADHQWSKERTQLELATKSLKETTIKLKELEKEYNIISSNGSVVYVGKEDLLNDLTTHYPDVSTKTKISILETIISEAEKYNINPLILYSLVYVESSFRHWLEHDLTTIVKNGKPVKIRAVGLTGVVWEWWGDKLKDAGIAETRGDLFDPVTNIKAGAFVYNEMYHMEMHKSANYKDESALLRYFGGDFVSYIGRIDAKIATFVRPNLYRKN